MPSDRSTQPRSPLAKKHSATSQSWAGMRRPSWIRGQTDGREDAPTVIATLFAPSRFSRIVILQTVFDTVVYAVLKTYDTADKKLNHILTYSIDYLLEISHDVFL